MVHVQLLRIVLLIISVWAASGMAGESEQKGKQSYCEGCTVRTREYVYQWLKKKCLPLPAASGPQLHIKNTGETEFTLQIGAEEFTRYRKSQRDAVMLLTVGGFFGVGLVSLASYDHSYSDDISYCAHYRGSYEYCRGIINHSSPWIPLCCAVAGGIAGLMAGVCRYAVGDDDIVQMSSPQAGIVCLYLRGLPQALEREKISIESVQQAFAPLTGFCVVKE